jgi:hypothetical protein
VSSDLYVLTLSATHDVIGVVSNLARQELLKELAKELALGTVKEILISNVSTGHYSIDDEVSDYSAVLLSLTL